MSDNRPADPSAAGPTGATDPGARSGAPALPGIGGDWPAQAADKIVQVVEQVRDRTTGPAIVAARGVVYGLLAGILGGICIVLLIIFLVRLLDTYVVGENNTWLAHLIVGVLFTGLGLLGWSKRRPPADDEA
jgi:hypothetical protein